MKPLVWSLLAILFVLSIPSLVLANEATAEPITDDVPALALDAPKISFWGLGNEDQFTGRIGRRQGRTELGFEATYLDKLPPTQSDAYAAGVYALYVVNPDAQFPIGGWLPGNWGLPATIPITLYIGVKSDLEFHEHKLMPALLVGGRIATGTNMSLGIEYQHAFTQENWQKLSPVADGDAFFLTLEAVWQ